MKEKHLFKIFEDFLIKDKGYSQTNLLFDPPIANKTGSVRISLDLIILHDNEYLALFEFKSHIDSFVKNQVKNQVNTFKKYLGNSELFCFLIYKNGENDFVILRLSEINEWEIIEKEDFPNFERLRLENVISKDIFEEIETEEFNSIKTEQNKIHKKRVQNVLISFLIAVISSIIIYYTSQTFYKDDKSLKEQLIKNEIDTQIKKLELRIADFTTDTIYISNVNNGNIDAFDNRLKIIELGLINSPEKVLELNKLNNSISNINQKIVTNNEVADLKLENLNNKLEWLFALVIGLIIGLLSSAIGYIFSVLKIKKE